MRLCVIGIAAFVVKVCLGAAMSPSAVADTAPSPKAVANGETVRVQLIPGLLLSLPLYVAVDKGFLAAHGLRPVLVSLATGPLGVQALTSGSIEIAGTGTEVFMNAYARQADIQLISSFVTTNTFTIEISKRVPLPHLKDGYPAVMQDLKGIVLGVSALGSSGHLYANALLSGAGLEPSSVKFLAVGSAVTAYPALVEGKIDGYMATEPMQTLCKVENTCVPVVDLRARDAPKQIAETNGGSMTFAAERAYIAANPVITRAFIQAITDATSWMRNPDNFGELMVVAKAHIGLGNFSDPDALLKSMLDDNLAYFGTTISRPAMVNLSRFLVEAKQITAEIDPEKFVYAEAPEPPR